MSERLEITELDLVGQRKNLETLKLEKIAKFVSKNECNCRVTFRSNGKDEKRLGNPMILNGIVVVAFSEEPDVVYVLSERGGKLYMGPVEVPA